MITESVVAAQVDKAPCLSISKERVPSKVFFFFMIFASKGGCPVPLTFFNYRTRVRSLAMLVSNSLTD